MGAIIVIGGTLLIGGGIWLLVEYLEYDAHFTVNRHLAPGFWNWLDDPRPKKDRW